MADTNQNRSNAFYTLLSLPATAMGFALSVQIAALSWILSTKYDLDIHEVGWVWLAGPVAGIIGQLSVGYLSDKVWFWNGRRRPFIWIGGVIAAAMLFLLTKLDVISSFTGITNMVIIALFVALLLDLAINISFNPTRSIIADMTTKGEARTKGYTWMQTISGAFGVLAYFIGATLDNYFLIYFGVGLVLVFSIIPPLFIKEPRHLTPDETDTEKKSSEVGIENKVELWKLYIAHAFTWLGVQTMFVYMYAYIEAKFGLSDSMNGKVIGYAFLVMNLVGFIIPKFILQPLGDRLGRVRVHLACLFIMALAYFACIFFAYSPGMLYFLMFFVGIGWAATVSLPFAIFSDKVPSDKMGWYMGIFNLSVVIPQIIVSGIIGIFISKAADLNIIFWICGICLFISSVLWILVKDKPAGEA